MLIADAVLGIGLLAVIAYLVLFGRRFTRVGNRFTDREARRSAAEERAPVALAAGDLGHADDEGPQTD